MTPSEYGQKERIEKNGSQQPVRSPGHRKQYRTDGTSRLCPLCLWFSPAPIYKDGHRVYYLCPRCDLRFLDPSFRLTSTREKARYLEHNNDIRDPRYQAFVKPLYDQIVKQIPQGSMGLDFGCGTGPVLADMLTQAGYEMRLFDPFFHPDRTNLSRKYDFIVASEVVEHLYNPGAEFMQLRRLISDGGLLGIMTLLWHPQEDFRGWHYRNDDSHVSFYSKSTFRWIQKHFRFKHLHVSEPRVIVLRT